jgi:hypothetical protein
MILIIIKPVIVNYLNSSKGLVKRGVLAIEVVIEAKPEVTLAVHHLIKLMQ